MHEIKVALLTGYLNTLEVAVLDYLEQFSKKSSNDSHSEITSIEIAHEILKGIRYIRAELKEPSGSFKIIVESLKCFFANAEATLQKNIDQEASQGLCALKAPQMLNIIQESTIELVDIMGFISRLTELTLNAANSYLSRKLLNIEFNQYKHDSFNLCNDVYFGVDDEVVTKFLILSANNRYLKYLQVSGEITDSAVEKLAKCTRFQTLEIRSTLITDQAGAILANTHHSHIKLVSDQLTEQAAKHLATNQNLKSVALNGKNIAIESVLHLLENKNIHGITIENDDISDDDIKRVIKALNQGHLKKLKLVSNKLTNRVGALLSTLSHLEELIIVSAEITHDFLIDFSEHCSLKKLRLYGKNDSEEKLHFFAYNQPKNHPNKIDYKEYLLDLPQDKFLATITSTVQIARFVLSDMELMATLNEVNSHKQKNIQTFQKSCAAYSLMILLNKLNLIPDEAVNNATELEIFSNIWSEPGQEADLERILAFLNTKNLRAAIYEDEQRVQNLTASNEKYATAYNKFFSTKKSAFNVKDANLLDMKFSQETYFILIVVNSTGPHAVLVTFEKGKYTYLDPEFGIYQTGDSINELVSTNKITYSGIGLTIHPPICTKTLAKNSFFIKPLPGRKETAKEEQNNCILQ